MNFAKMSTISLLFLMLFSFGFAEVNAQSFKVRKNRFKWKKPKVKDPIKTVTDLVKDTGRELGKAGDNVVREANKVTGNIEKATTKAGKDFATTIRKAGDDTAAEGRRGGKNLGDAGVAVFNYTERQAKGYGKILTDAEKRIREGKFADALYHVAVDPLSNTEENLALATQESKLVNIAGQVAASAYGGPGGAAAYASWSTFRKTGDADLALRVGIITGLTNAGFAAAGTLPSGTVPEIAKKAVVTGAVGGLGVAASGGDEAAIREAFLLSGGMVLVQDGYKKFTGHPLDARAAEGEPYCMLTNPYINSECGPPPEAYVRNPDGTVKYEKGQPVVDFSKLDPKRSYVGEWYNPEKPINIKSDNSLVMQSVAKVPGMNAMGLFHDKWAFAWDMNSLTNKATIAPAIVITYFGTPAPINDLIQETNENAAKDENSVRQARINSSEEEQASSFLCMKDGLSRSIFIATGTDKSQIACVVIYQKDKETKEDLAPWYALKDQDYCNIPSVKLARDHVERGWSCYSR